MEKRLDRIESLLEAAGTAAGAPAPAEPTPAAPTRPEDDSTVIRLGLPTGWKYVVREPPRRASEPDGDFIQTHQTTDDRGAPVVWYEGWRWLGRNAQGHHEFHAPKDGSIMIWIAAALGEKEEGFYLGRHEVTWAQHLRFCGETGHRPPARPSWLPEGFEQHPVVNVSWTDAAAYLKWARLRLPRETEWRRAAFGEGDSRFPWKNADPWFQEQIPDAPPGAYRRRYYANYAPVPPEADGFAFTSPVTAFSQGRSPAGAHDLAGNVWEWLEDSEEVRGRRVRRGGSYADAAHRLTAGEGRALAAPHAAAEDGGFRPAR